MSAHDPPKHRPQQHPDLDEPLLRDVSPRQIAGAIRSLDSRLVGIEVGDNAGTPMLVYIFAVGGKMQAFRLPVATAAVDSIADLYPAAAAREQELQRQIGVTFAPPTEQRTAQ